MNCTNNFKVGDIVKVKSLNWYNKSKNNFNSSIYSSPNFTEGMSKFCGKKIKIAGIDGWYVAENGCFFCDEYLEEVKKLELE